jgi:WhiB family transcriptional regulator, redox-sensing transcriptional regulator
MMKQYPASNGSCSTLTDVQKVDEGLRAATLACLEVDPDLFFSEDPADLEVAKSLCAGCPAQRACLASALARHEATGVWGGEIFEHGRVIARKRRRGRPRRTPVEP